MKDFLSAVFGVVVGILIPVVLILGMVGVVCYLDIYVKESNIVKIYDNTELLYEGKFAFVSVNSGGTATTVRIYRKLWPVPILGKVITSKNIRIVTP